MCVCVHERDWGKECRRLMEREGGGGRRRERERERERERDFFSASEEYTPCSRNLP